MKISIPVKSGGEFMTSDEKKIWQAFKAAGIIILLLLLSNGANAATIIVNTSGGGMFSEIQDAINNANAGDTILVDSGSYNENIIVDKSLFIKGIDTGGGKPVVNAGGGESAITLSGGNITIEGFVAMNGRANWSMAGIYVNSSNNVIKNNEAFNNSQGVYMLGSTNSTLMHNVLIGNNASNNIYYGLNIDHSSVSNITQNIMTGNGHNFKISGIEISHFDNMIDTSNLVDGKPIYYVKDASDSIYDSSINAGTFLCISCINVTIKDLNPNTNGYGIFLWNTSYSRIQNIYAFNNDDGISILNSYNNTLNYNYVSNNYNGISLGNSNSIIIDGNTVSDNFNGIYFSLGSNDSTVKDNDIYSNSGYGIFLGGAYRNILRSNEVEDNDGYGIYLGGSDNNKIVKNDALNNKIGIILDSSDINTLYGNVASNNDQNGFYLGFSNNNRLKYNTATDNGNGIFLWYSVNNTLRENSMMANIYNFGLSGSEQSQYNNEIDTSNRVDDKHILYIKDAVGSFYNSSDAGTVYCINCVNVTIRDMNLSNNNNGILLWNTSGSRIENLNLSNNANGISLMESGENLVDNNVIMNNSRGISLELFSSDNLIYNNFFNNSNNAFSNGHNTWNISRTTGENGTLNLGGNVWAMPDGTGFSQTCEDIEKDGICDSSYVINPDNIDFLPLVYKSPYIKFIDPTPANSAVLIQNNAYVNTDIYGYQTAFIDWNHTLLAWWRFNSETGENRTEFMDWSLNGNNGICYGKWTCPDPTSGKFGKALSFNGFHDFVTIRPIASDTSGTTLAWIKSDGDYENNQTVMAGADKIGSDESVRYGIILRSQYCPSGDWRTVIADGIISQNICSGQQFNSTNFPPGIWKQIAVTYNGSVVNLYLDDMLIRTVPQTVSGAGDAQPYAIGRLGGSEKYYFHGDIDEARIFARDLSYDEIKASYYAGKYKLSRNFTDLPKGMYDYVAYAQNPDGTVGQTELRTLTLDP